MRRFSLASALALVILVLGCGSHSPTAPPASSTVRGLTITGAEALLTGLSTFYTVTAAFGDGTSRTVTPTWSSSNAEVATVDVTGRLEGRAHGSTILTASSGGQAVSKTVRVINNYGGTWQGRFVVNACDAPSSWCAAMEVDYFSFPIHLEITQTGSDQSDITARLIFTSFDRRTNVSGRVTPDGRLNLAGSSEVLDRAGRVWANFQVTAWDTALSDGGMTGRWQQRFSILQPPSTEYMENELETMTRRSNSAGAMSAR
jgi:hypothetical protein